MRSEEDFLDIDTISPSLRTNRIDRYNALAQTQATEESDDEEEIEESEKESSPESHDEEEEEHEHSPPFQNFYQLFTAGLVIGYTKDKEHDTTGSREFYRLDSMRHTTHGSCIRMIFYLVAAENTDNFESESSVWNKLLRYADWGVGWIYRHRDRENGIEFIDIMDELDDLWEERVQAALDTAQEERDSGAGDITWEG